MKYVICQNYFFLYTITKNVGLLCEILVKNGAIALRDTCKQCLRGHKSQLIHTNTQPHTLTNTRTHTILPCEWIYSVGVYRADKTPDLGEFCVGVLRSFVSPAVHLLLVEDRGL